MTSADDSSLLDVIPIPRRILDRLTLRVWREHPAKIVFTRRLMPSSGYVKAPLIASKSLELPRQEKWG